MEDIRIPFSPAGTLDASWFEHTTHSVVGKAILVPGFLDTHRYDHIEKLATTLQHSGWDVVSFTPQGIWKSDGEIAEYTITTILQNIQTVLQWLSERSLGKKLYIVGHSLGALTSLLTAHQFGESVDGVIAIMPPSQLTALNLLPLRLRWKIQGKKVFEQDMPDNSAKKQTFTIPYSFVQDAAQYKGKQIVPQLQQRILFIAGSEDRLIPARHVQSLAQEHQPAFPCVVAEGARHIYRKNAQSIQNINQIIIDFLR